MKKFVFALATLASVSAFAAEKYCGNVTVNGVQDFTYAFVLDGNDNPGITGNTKDPNDVVKLIQDQNCYCVKGDVAQVGEFADFTKVVGLYECNGGPKIAGQ